MRKQVQIDGAGRMVIPKEIRDRYGFRAGYHLEMEDTGTEVILRPSAESKVTLRIVNGFPVFDLPRATSPDNSDIVDHISADRDDRVRHVLGE